MFSEDHKIQEIKSSMGYSLRKASDSEKQWIKTKMETFYVGKKEKKYEIWIPE